MSLANISQPAATVCMFPGLDAAYPDMLPNFCLYHPWALELVEQWERQLGLPLLAGQPGNAKERELLRQMRTHCLNLLWWRQTQADIGGKIVCCGHSLGFYAALVAAGVLSEQASWYWLQTVFDAAWQDFSEHSNPISVLTTIAPIDVQHLSTQFSVEILARNSAQQIVVYGWAVNVDAMCCSLDWTTLRRNELGTVVPFHSIEMCRVVEKLFQDRVPHGCGFADPVHEVWSHIDGESLDSAEACYRALLEQTMRTVNWQILIQNLKDRYRAAFIEIGPNKVLSQLVHWNCPAAQVRHVDHLRKAGRHLEGEAA